MNLCLLLLLLFAQLAGAQDCSLHSASVSITLSSGSATVNVATTSVPFTDSLRLVIAIGTNTVALPIQSKWLTVPGSGVAWSTTWVFGTAIVNATDVPAAAVFLAFGEFDSVAFLRVNYVADDGCVVTSADSQGFNPGRQAPTSVAAPQLAFFETTNAASPFTHRDGDITTMVVSTPFAPRGDAFVDFVPASATACVPYFRIKHFDVLVGSNVARGFASLDSATMECDCSPPRTVMSVCTSRGGVVLNAQAFVTGLTRATPTATHVFGSVASGVVPASFSALARAASEIVANGVVGMEPDCTFATMRRLYRRGDPVEVVCDFPALPVATSTILRVGATNMPDVLNSYVQVDSEANPIVKRGRVVYRRRVRWTAGAALRTAVYNSLDSLRLDLVLATVSRTFTVTLAYNYYLGNDRTKLFFASGVATLPPSGVSATFPNGVLADASFSASNVAPPAPCSANVTTATPNPALRGEVVSTSVRCDARISRFGIRVLTLAAPALSQELVCASTASDASGLRPTYSVRAGEMQFSFAYTFVVGAGGLFGQPTCLANVNGLLRSEFSITAFGVSSPLITRVDVALASGRPPDSLAAHPGSGLGADPELVRIVGSLTAPHSSILVRLLPATVYNGAGFIPQGAINVEVGPAVSTEVDAFSRVIRSSAVVSTLDRFSSRPFDVFVRVSNPDILEPLFVLLNQSLVFPPAAAPPVFVPSATNRHAVVQVNDDVAVSHYWVWCEEPRWVYSYADVRVPFAAHGRVETPTLRAFSYEVPLYLTPAEASARAAGVLALPPPVRPYAPNAENIALLLGLEPGPRTRLVQLWAVMTDGTRGETLLRTPVTASEATVFSTPSQVLAIASPVSHSTWQSSVPFVVAYRVSQSPGPSHAMHISLTSSAVVVVTLVAKVAVQAMAAAGASIFDLPIGNLTSSPHWQVLSGTMTSFLEPGTYDFAIQALTSSGDSSTVARVVNVTIDAATSLPQGATVLLESLSGEVRERSTLVVRFTPPETYVQARFVLTTGDDPSSRASMELLAPGAAFEAGVVVERRIAITGAIVRSLASTTAPVVVRAWIEVADAGGNPLRRAPLQSEEPLIGRRDIVDFRATVAVESRTLAHVRFEAALLLSTMRLQLVPISAPATRVLHVVPPPPNALTGVTSIEFTIELLGPQTSPLILPKPSEPGIADGTYLAMFVIEGTFPDAVTSYTANQTAPVVVDSTTIPPSIAECMVLGTTNASFASLPTAGIHSVLQCEVIVPEPFATLNLDFRTADTIVASAVFATGPALNRFVLAWRIGTLFSEAALPPGANVQVNSRGLLDASLALRVSYSDRANNPAATATSALVVVRASTQSVAVHLSGTLVTSRTFASLTFGFEASAYITLLAHPAVGESLSFNATGRDRVTLASALTNIQTGPGVIALPDGAYTFELRSLSVLRTQETVVFVTPEHLAGPVVSTQAERAVLTVDATSLPVALARDNTGVATIGSLHRFTCSAPEPVVSRVLWVADESNVTRVTVPIPNGAPCFVEWVIGQSPRDAQATPFANVSGVPTDVIGHYRGTFFVRMRAEDTNGNPLATSNVLRMEMDSLMSSALPTLTLPAGGTVVGRGARTTPVAYELPTTPLVGSVVLYFNAHSLEGSSMPVSYSIRMADLRSPPPLYTMSLTKVGQDQDPVVDTPILQDVIPDGIYDVVLCYTASVGSESGCARTSLPVVVDTTAIAPVFEVRPAFLHPRTREPVFNSASGVQLRATASDATTPTRLRLVLHHRPLAGHSSALGVGVVPNSALSAGLVVFMAQALTPGVFDVSLPLVGGASTDTLVGSSPIPDGNYSMTVLYVDAVGNEAAASAVSRRVIVDSRSLPVRLVSPIAGQTFTIGMLVSVQVLLDANEAYSSIRLELANALGGIFVYDMRIGSQNAIVCSWDTAETQPAVFTPCFSSGAALPNGVYDITVRAVDAIGNPAATTLTQSVSIFTRPRSGNESNPTEDSVTLPPTMSLEVNGVDVAGTTPRNVDGDSTVVLRLGLGEVAAPGSLILDVFVDGSKRVSITPATLIVTWRIGSRIPGAYLFESDALVPTGRFSGRVHFVFSYMDSRNNPRAAVTSGDLSFAAAETLLGLPQLASVSTSTGPWRYAIVLRFPSAVPGSTYILRTAAPFSTTGAVPASGEFRLDVTFNSATSTFVDAASRVVFRAVGTHVVNATYTVRGRSVSAQLLVSVEAPSASSSIPIALIAGVSGGAVLAIAGGALAYWQRSRIAALVTGLRDDIANLVDSTEVGVEGG